MEWIEHTLSLAVGLFVGATSTVLTLYFWWRRKLNEVRRQEQINSKEMEEMDATFHDREIRRTEERYEERIKIQEARHMREMQSQSDSFHERLKEVDEALREHSNALKGVHAENIECQRRNAILEIKISGLLAQNEDQERRIGSLMEDIQVLRKHHSKKTDEFSAPKSKPPSPPLAPPAG